MEIPEVVRDDTRGLGSSSESFLSQEIDDCQGCHTKGKIPNNAWAYLCDIILSMRWVKNGVRAEVIMIAVLYGEFQALPMFPDSENS